VSACQRSIFAKVADKRVHLASWILDQVDDHFKAIYFGFLAAFKLFDQARDERVVSAGATSRV